MPERARDGGARRAGTAAARRALTARCGAARGDWSRAPPAPAASPAAKLTADGSQGERPGVDGHVVAARAEMHLLRVPDRRVRTAGRREAPAELEDDRAELARDPLLDECGPRLVDAAQPSEAPAD